MDVKHESKIKLLKVLREEMFAKWCPINKANCEISCVHFDAGCVFGNGEEYRIKKPSCKLWK